MLPTPRTKSWNKTKIRCTRHLPFEHRQPVGQIFGLVNDGLYTEADFEDVTTGKLKPGLPVPKFSDRVYPGDIKYVDFNGDGEITETDKTAIGGTVNPELVYGFGINLSYKNIDFGAFFQGNGRTYRIIGETKELLTRFYYRCRR